MKKTILLIFAFAMSTLVGYAQESSSLIPDYNRFSIDLGLGIAQASSPVTKDIPFYTKLRDFAFEGGMRYMFNNKVGLKVSGLYFTSTNAGSPAFDLDAEFFRANLEGVANLGNVLGLREFTQHFNLLFHAGAGMSHVSLPSDAELANESETMLNFMGGITPQIKITDHLAFNLDLSVIGNLGQNLTFDGRPNVQTQNFDGMVVSVIAGVSIYFGDYYKHADWVDNSVENPFEERVKELENELAKIQTEMLDTDKDGVADYLDRQPNTTSGFAVNTKGESVDMNLNGIPDEIEPSLQDIYMTKRDVKKSYFSNGVQDVKPNANDNLINVYFKFNSIQPQYYSLDAINQIVKYMKENPKAEAVLTGYSDQIGNAEYNNTLSENRAKKVFDILIASGIEESRLSFKGGGVDDSVDKNSKEARQIIRRVSFELR